MQTGDHLSRQISTADEAERFPAKKSVVTRKHGRLSLDQLAIYHSELPSEGLYMENNFNKMGNQEEPTREVQFTEVSSIYI
jgi:hypothetical protein